MKDYNANRSVLGFINFIGWVLFVGGLFLAIYFAANTQEMPFARKETMAWVNATPALIVAFFGLFIIAAGAVGGAVIDSAEHNELMVTHLRELVALQKQQGGQPTSPLKGKTLAAPGLHEPKTATHEDGSPSPIVTGPQMHPKPQPIMHQGRRIEGRPGGYRIDGISFDTLDSAKSYIDSTSLKALR